MDGWMTGWVKWMDGMDEMTILVWQADLTSMANTSMATQSMKGWMRMGGLDGMNIWMTGWDGQMGAMDR